MEKSYLTIEAAAELLRITPAEMKELRNRGEIRGVADRGTWKFDVEDITKLARNRGLPSTVSSVEATQSAEPAEAATAAVSSPVVRESPGPVADAGRIRQELLAQSSPITSRMIIDYLVDVCRVTREDAESVVDGFWNDVIDITHYKQGRSLVIPHFGAFTLCRLDDQTALAFASRPIELIRQQLQQRRGVIASERWIDYFQRSRTGDVTGLSVKRRMAVRMASETGRDLRLVHRVLCELFDVVCEFFASGDKTIRWAMRGEMAPVSWRDEKSYGFRCYRRLSARLPNWAETQRITGRTASRTTGWQTSLRTTRKRKSRSRKTKDAGCLVSLLVVIVVLVGVLVAAV
jgi:hypothetical protein